MAGARDGLRRARGRRVRPRRAGPDAACGAAAVARHGGRRALRRASRAAAGCSASACRSLGVGLAWARRRASRRAGGRARTALRRRRRRRVARRRASSVAVDGGARRSPRATAKDLNLWIGRRCTRRRSTRRSTSTSRAIGHALAPWSAFLPFAFGRLLLVARRAARGRRWRAAREPGARRRILVGATVALVAHGYLAARTDLVAFSGPALCAVACAVAIRDFERGAHASIAVGLGTLLLAAVLHHDFHELPEKAYQAFGITGATFPESFKDTALDALVGRPRRLRALRVPHVGRARRRARAVRPGELRARCSARCARPTTASWRSCTSRSSRARRSPGSSSSIGVADARALAAADVVDHPRRRAQRVVGRRVRAARRASSGFSSRATCGSGPSVARGPCRQASLTRGFEPFEELLRAAAPGGSEASRRPCDAAGRGVGSSLAVLVARSCCSPSRCSSFVAWLVAFGFKRVRRALLLAVPSGVAFFLVDGLRRRRAAASRAGARRWEARSSGFVLCFFYYPALANQLSPKEVFESYRQVCPGAPLALLGVGGRTAAYYAGGQPQTLNDAPSAYDWLVGRRRRSGAASRSRPRSCRSSTSSGASTRPSRGRTCPSLDARSSQILLAASTLGAGREEREPARRRSCSRRRPHPQRRPRRQHGRQARGHRHRPARRARAGSSTRSRPGGPTT